MKPSERIKEIQLELYEVHKKDYFDHDYEPCGMTLFLCKASAIQAYLDEQYDNNLLDNKK